MSVLRGLEPRAAGKERPGLRAELLKRRLFELQALAALQRGLRLGLRALWLGLGGLLIAWGVNSLWGWLPERRTWALLALGMALLPLLAYALSLLPLLRSRRAFWVWAFDRRLGLQEQVSTAFELARGGRRAGGSLSEALLAEVLESLPQVRERMLRRGWFLERDLVAALLVLLLALMAYSSTWLRSYADQIGAMSADISQPSGMLPSSAALPPPPAAAPQGEDPSGQGEQGAGQQDQGQPGGDQGEPQPPEGLDGEALSRALEQLGQELSGQAPTYDLGQELQQGDLEGAASEMEDLADRVDELSPQTRQELAEALENAAGEVEAAGDPQMAQDMREAAEALRADPQNGETGAGEALDQLAEDLRGQAGSQAGTGSGDNGSGQSGSAEPAERLQGQGGDLELPLEDSSQSGLLSPAPQGAAGEDVVGGSQDSSAGASGQYGSPLVPNSFLWKWRDIISSYFDR